MQHDETAALDWGTTVVGFLTAAIADGHVVLTILGLIVGFGGLACGLSREIGAWLDRYRARKRNQP